MPGYSICNKPKFCQVQAEAANALNVVCRESANNQNFIISIGGIPPLVKLVQSTNIEVGSGMFKFY